MAWGSLRFLESTFGRKGSAVQYHRISQHDDRVEPDDDPSLPLHSATFPSSTFLSSRLHPLSASHRALLLTACALLIASLSYWLYTDPLSPLWPSPRPSPPLCLPLSPAFDAYLEQHRRLRHLMQTDCPSLWRGPTYPRMLVHECHAGCSGLGDRVGKAAGLFLYALLSNRSLFLDHTLPTMSEWYEPTPLFDWSVTGAVKDCLAYGRRVGAQERFNIDALGLLGRFPPVHEARWEDNHWGWQRGWRGAVRKTLLARPAADVRLPSEAVLVIDGPVNLLRPDDIVSEFSQAVDEALRGKFIPYPAHADDGLSTLLTGCLLERLWRPSARTLQLVAPLMKQAKGGCLVSVHVRFGDLFMFHYNASTLEGTETDRHVEPSPDVVTRSLRCAVIQAHDACGQQAQQGGLSVFFTTDAPQFNGWFDVALAGLIRWDAARWGDAAFPSIRLLRSPWEKPGNVVSFGIIAQAELEEAEQQLMSDWTMLSLATATVTTGSVFSYTAAANGLHFPIDAETCAVRWGKLPTLPWSA